MKYLFIEFELQTRPVCLAIEHRWKSLKPTISPYFRAKGKSVQWSDNYSFGTSSNMRVCVCVCLWFNIIWLELEHPSKGRNRPVGVAFSRVNESGFLEPKASMSKVSFSSFLIFFFFFFLVGGGGGGRGIKGEIVGVCRGGSLNACLYRWTLAGVSSGQSRKGPDSTVYALDPLDQPTNKSCLFTIPMSRLRRWYPWPQKSISKHCAMTNVCENWNAQSIPSCARERGNWATRGREKLEVLMPARWHVGNRTWTNAII